MGVFQLFVIFLCLGFVEITSRAELESGGRATCGRLSLTASNTALTVNPSSEVTLRLSARDCLPDCARKPQLESPFTMSVMVAKVARFSDLDSEQRAQLVKIYRGSFKRELEWMEAQGRSTTSSLSVASAFSYIFDNKRLFLAVRVSAKYAAEAAKASAQAASVPTSSWIEDVTVKSMGGNQSPFTDRARSAVDAASSAPIISMRVSDIEPSDILGFVTIEQTYSHQDAFLRCLAVSPKAQRLGVGKFLMAFIVATFGRSNGMVA